MSRGLFITGTGTDIGKTFVTALIVKKLNEAGKNPGYYKAAMSGNVRREDGTLIPGDAAFVKEISGIAQPLEQMCPYVYEHAYSPHLASRIEGNPVSLACVRQGFEKVCKNYDYVTVEGSGGILCPINYDGDKIWLEDVIKELRLPTVIIADAGLGTINNVLLTTAYMRTKNMVIKGLIFNHFHPGNVMEEDNLKMCAEMTGLPILARVTDGANDIEIDTEALTALYEGEIL